jgi:hypothetical protein
VVYPPDWLPHIYDDSCTHTVRNTISCTSPAANCTSIYSFEGEVTQVNLTCNKSDENQTFVFQVNSSNGDMKVVGSVTLILTAGALTQTVTEGTAIKKTTFTGGGGATDVILSGALPAGVVAERDGTTLTVSGTPSAAGSFPYTVNASSALEWILMRASITVNTPETPMSQGLIIGLSAGIPGLVVLVVVVATVCVVCYRRRQRRVEKELGDLDGLVEEKKEKYTTLKGI